MCSKKAGVPFNGTAEQKEALLNVIAELKDQKGALMPIMQKAQDIYGYLPIEVQKIISDETHEILKKFADESDAIKKAGKNLGKVGVGLDILDFAIIVDSDI